jgi:hypothetical protein
MRAHGSLIVMKGKKKEWLRYMIRYHYCCLVRVGMIRIIIVTVLHLETAGQSGYSRVLLTVVRDLCESGRWEPLTFVSVTKAQLTEGSLEKQEIIHGRLESRSAS